MPTTQSQRLRFAGTSGEELAAVLERPTHSAPIASALLAHCFTCSKDLKALFRISRALAEAGLAVLRFDFTGIGESEGDFADTNFSSNLDDLLAAAEFLGREVAPPSLLVGHSLGGAAVLATAPRLASLKAVATIAAPSDTAHLGRRLVRLTPELEQAGVAEVRLGGRPFRIRRQLLEDLDEPHLDDALVHFSAPLMIFHAPNDEIVSIDHARRLFERARHPKSFVSLDDADHLLTSARHAEFLTSILIPWARFYIS